MLIGMWWDMIKTQAFICVSKGLPVQLASLLWKEKHFGLKLEQLHFVFLPENQTHVSVILRQQAVSWTCRPNTLHCCMLSQRAHSHEKYNLIWYCNFNNVSVWTETWNHRTVMLWDQSLQIIHKDHIDREGTRLTWSTLFHWPETSMWMCERWISPVLLSVSYEWQKRATYCVRPPKEKQLHWYFSLWGKESHPYSHWNNSHSNVFLVRVPTTHS